MWTGSGKLFTAYEPVIPEKPAQGRGSTFFLDRWGRNLVSYGNILRRMQLGEKAVYQIISAWIYRTSLFIWFYGIEANKWRYLYLLFYGSL